MATLADELVALGVGHDHPRRVALADVDVSGAQGPQPVGVCRLVVAGVRQQVEVHPVPHGLLGGRAHELQVGPDALGSPQPRPVVGHLVHRPARRPAPEAGHGPRVGAVDDDRRDRPGVLVDRTRLQDAEHVALRVGQDRPRHLTLADVGRRRPELPQPRDELRLMRRGGAGEVEVRAVPDRLGVRDPDHVDADGGEVRPVEAHRFDVGHAGCLAVHAPPEGVRPELAECGVVPGLEVHLSKLQCTVHDPNACIPEASPWRPEELSTDFK